MSISVPLYWTGANRPIAPIHAAAAALGLPWWTIAPFGVTDAEADEPGADAHPGPGIAETGPGDRVPFRINASLESGGEQALREELRDVLLQVVFHARIAAERTDGTGYTIDDVADGIAAKLVRRHPHVFGDVTVSGAEEVKRNWDQIKRQEKAGLAGRAGAAAAGDAAVSALDGVPFGQPALALAAQLQRRAARAGVPDELALLDGASGPGGSGGSGESGQASVDIGAELFRLVAKARELGLDPEMELRAAARRYRALVRAWERSRQTAGS
jgi:XTP/dITP diphosphohydrolase